MPDLRFLGFSMICYSPLTIGDMVGYVILEGKGRLFSCVKPYVFSKIEELKLYYYITNQVLPTLKNSFIL